LQLALTYRIEKAHTAMNTFPPRGGWSADPTAADWAQRLGLKKRGTRAYEGPCPLCGRTDRFHVTERNGKILIGCRGCMDGQTKEVRRRRFGDLMRQVLAGALASKILILNGEKRIPGCSVLVFASRYLAVW